MPHRSQLISFGIHGCLIALRRIWKAKEETAPAPREVAHIVYPMHTRAPGGGGGFHSTEAARRGVLPQRSAAVFVPPTMRLIDFQPKLAVPMALDTPPEVPITAGQLGDPNGRGVLGGGSGGPEGFGDGVVNSIGSSNGDLWGAGAGDVYTAGHGVSVPAPIHRVEPEYSEAARRARISGGVVVYAEIGPDGKPHNLRVIHGLGLGLDAKALEAVGQWLFKPGMRNGRPVTVRATFEVNFRLL